jgi:hypothetical protein
MHRKLRLEAGRGWVVVVAVAVAVLAITTTSDACDADCQRARRGPHGPTGPNGATGSPGSLGSTGSQGATGPDGLLSSVIFLSQPLTTNWTNHDGEVHLYSVAVPLVTQRVASIHSTIAAYIDTNDNGHATFNTYRLYVNNVLVGHAGYETDTDSVFAPRLETSEVIWTGLVNPPIASINVTAELPVLSLPYSSSSESLDLPTSSTVANVTSNPFRFAVGAFLRIVLL